jgi:FkbM family methyltransferase
MAGASNPIKTAFRRLINGLGYDIVGYLGGSPRGRMARLLARHRIDVILDVGAFEGAFGRDMRGLGFGGRIVSFEPRRESFERLGQAAAGDEKWQIVPYGLGNQDEERAINVAANAQSSSVLPMLEAHRIAAPESAYQAQETISLRRLDGVFGDYCRPGERVFLKIDTQGFEPQVLEGAGAILSQVPLLQLEASLVPLFEGAGTIEDTIRLVRGLGYEPADILPTFYHHDSGHLMQADLLSVRR